MNRQPEWLTFGARVKWARQNAKPKKLTQVQLATKSGLSQSTISDIERDEIASSGFTASLAAALKVSALWLESNRGLPYDARGSAPATFEEPTDDVPARKRTPVLGEARLGDEEFFEESSYDTPDGFLKYERIGRSYALRCRGDSMRPTIKPGFYMVIEPDVVPEEGDTVVVQLKDGRRMIKILNRLSTREKAYEFTSVNEDYKPISVEPRDVAHVHHAMGPLPPRFHEPLAVEADVEAE